MLISPHKPSWFLVVSNRCAKCSSMKAQCPPFSRERRALNYTEMHGDLSDAAVVFEPLVRSKTIGKHAIEWMFHAADLWRVDEGLGRGPCFWGLTILLRAMWTLVSVMFQRFLIIVCAVLKTLQRNSCRKTNQINRYFIIHCIFLASADISPVCLWSTTGQYIGKLTSIFSVMFQSLLFNFRVQLFTLVLLFRM